MNEVLHFGFLMCLINTDGYDIFLIVLVVQYIITFPFANLSRHKLAKLIVEILVNSFYSSEMHVSSYI